MVEEHVGKKRRKEIRQAVTMNDELRKSLIVIWGTIGGGLAILLVLMILTGTGVISLGGHLSSTIPLAILVIIMISVAPRMSRFWTLREQYKNHLKRFNISKEDMRALRDADS